MVLKEAFRMQNYLDSIFRNALSYLSNKNNVMTIVEEHHRKKSNPQAEDEEIEQKKDYDYDVNVVLDFIMDLLAEKANLATAISETKLHSPINMDNAIYTNKNKQGFMDVLKYMSDLQGSEAITTGRGFLINSEGNQMPYSYDVTRISTINFDRNKVKGILKKLQKETDATSIDIDKLNITLEVNYNPSYELDDSFEECFNKYLKREVILIN